MQPPHPSPVEHPMPRVVLACALLAVPLSAAPAQNAHTRSAATFTHADSLRGSLTSPARTWWDVTFYDLHVTIQPADSSIRGYNRITYRVLRPARQMQLDLQEPLQVDSMVQGGRRVAYRRDGNAFFATLPAVPRGATRAIAVYYHGKPQAAVRPPWSGGFTWTHDSL